MKLGATAASPLSLIKKMSEDEKSMAKLSASLDPAASWRVKDRFDP